MLTGLINCTMDWVHLFFDHNCSSCLQVARPHQGFFNSNGQHYLTGLVVKKNQIFKATLLQSRIIDELKGVFLQHLQGKPRNIYRLQKNPCRFLLRILQKKPLNHPVNPCKHLQCRFSVSSDFLFTLDDLGTERS